MGKVVIDRGSLHQHLDEWLDAIEVAPLSMEDGEEHFFRVRGAREAYDDDDNALVGFSITTGNTRGL